MTDSNRPPSDDDIEELMRSMRPHPAKTVAVLALLILALVGGLAFIVSSSFSSVHSLSFSTKTTSACPLPPAGLSQIDSDIGHNVPVATVAKQTVGVRTHRKNDEGVHAFGTGFLIDDGIVVSAAHIFTSMPGSETEPVHVLCANVQHVGAVKYFDTVRDVVIITAPACEAKRLTFSRTEPVPNDALHVTGYSFATHEGLAYWFHRGTSLIPSATPDVNRPDIEEELALRLAAMADQHISPYLAVAGAFIPGNSGSPVCDDRGRIVGMLVAADSKLNRSFAVRSDVILDALAMAGAASQ